MSRNHRRREEPASSHWEPGHRRSYADGYSRGRYGPPADTVPRGSFNYWRDEAIPTSHLGRSQRSYEREYRDERWRDDGRSWRAESSYSRGRHDYRPIRDRNNRESWRDSAPHHRDTGWRPRHATYSPPYDHRPPTRPRTSIESIPQIPKTPPPKPPRKASPPTDTSSQSLRPSPRYLSPSQQSSEVLHDPTQTRKLLVLDLNGTLLIRSARLRNSSGPQLRPVQPRPYMQSFRHYLFCPETQAWLDTMVWSSAQPHSVDNMVDKVFGTTRGELKAVWNRKSLGLSEVDYHRKAVTTKDLAKAWDLFASALSPEKSQGHSGVASQSKTTHSALTTLLLDDSPHKAILQPYNHVCIPEYNNTRRQHDLRSFLATKGPKQAKKVKQNGQSEQTSHSTDHVVPELLPKDAPTELTEAEPYDVTLLAVIGILEAAKSQSNVAGWIRQGGLWGSQEKEEAGALGVRHRNVIMDDDKVVLTGNDASRTSDPNVAPAPVHSETKMWFNDASVVACWVARGRGALTELDISVAHGITG